MKLFGMMTCYCLLLGCSDSTTQQEVDTKETTLPVGQETYMMYCAQCHGPDGDGKAFIELDRPARSFVDGGFSFGNTVHAIAKTTASGIPGTPMPPFVDVLNQQQIDEVAMYVRSFAPSIQDATPDETEMVVLDRPLVVRGMIPPLHEGLELHPRGLVVGNPDRFSYEYLADNVCLLAVRQGNFVRRPDWGNRGGAPLELLGSVVVTVQEGEPYELFTTEDGTPLKAQLTSTNTLGEYGVVRYKLMTPEGTRIAQVEEVCIPTTGTRTLIEQQLTIDALQPILIHPPSSTDVSNAPLIPKGTHDYIITHAIYKGDLGEAQ